MVKTKRIFWADGHGVDKVVIDLSNGVTIKIKINEEVDSVINRLKAGANLCGEPMKNVLKKGNK